MPKRRTYSRRRRFTKRKRTYRRRKMSRKTISREQTMFVKAQIRQEMFATNWTKGNSGVRMALRWGALGDVASANYQQGHVMSPFTSYEWSFWSGKFAEYKISGVKIHFQPAVHQNSSDERQELMCHMGTFKDQIANAEDLTTNIMYQCNDFGSSSPDPSKPKKRYYRPAAYLRRRFKDDWLSTADTVYSRVTTHLNWEIYNVTPNALVGEIMLTYYIKFRYSSGTNIAPD